MFHRQIIDTQTMFQCYVRLQEGIQVCIPWFLRQVHNFYPFPAPRIPASHKGKEFMLDANHWQETNIYIYMLWPLPYLHVYYVTMNTHIYIYTQSIVAHYTHIHAIMQDKDLVQKYVSLFRLSNSKKTSWTGINWPMAQLKVRIPCYVEY